MNAVEMLIAGTGLSPSHMQTIAEEFHKKGFTCSTLPIGKEFHSLVKGIEETLPR